jgi:hypothetical protein
MAAAGGTHIKIHVALLLRGVLDPMPVAITPHQTGGSNSCHCHSPQQLKSLDATTSQAFTLALANCSAADGGGGMSPAG